MVAATNTEVEPVICTEMELNQLIRSLFYVIPVISFTTKAVQKGSRARRKVKRRAEV